MTTATACVVYHKDDNDGVFSGAFMVLYYMHALNIHREQIAAIGVDYNDLKSWDRQFITDLFIKYDYITLTDISLPVELMEFMADMWLDRFLWFDHHAPIIKAVTDAGINDKIHGKRTTEHSALYLTYEYLFNTLDKLEFDDKFCIDQFFNNLSKWDSFHFESSKDKLNCQELNTGVTYLYNLNIDKVIDKFKWLITTEPLSMPTYTAECYNAYKEAYNIGSVLLANEFQKYDELIQRSCDFSWNTEETDGTKIPACALFIQGPTNSTMFRKADDGNTKIGIVFKHNVDSSWSVSAYHTNTKYDAEHHIGEWCRKKYNGGGHAGAGGFTITEEQFINILKKKVI